MPDGLAPNCAARGGDVSQLRLQLWQHRHLRRLEPEWGCFAGAPFGDIGADPTKPSSGTPTVAFARLRDGASYTMLVAELVQGQGSDLRGFTWYGPTSGYASYLGPNMWRLGCVDGAGSMRLPVLHQPALYLVRAPGPVAGGTGRELFIRRVASTS